MTKQIVSDSESSSNDAGQDGFPEYTLKQFQDDVRWIFYLQVQMIGAMTDAQTALHIIGKSHVDGQVFLDCESIPDEINFSYANIRHTPFAQSLEAMYRYAYHGEVDDCIEPLGPGGYHIAMAAIVSDLGKSSLVNFWTHLGGVGKDSVRNCLRTAELANARLVLEGEERFFNFDGKDDDYDSLLAGATLDSPKGGYGAALTIRQMALLANMGEMTIRTVANPKRSNHIPTFSHAGRTLISIDHAKAWLQEKGRYVSIKRCTDAVLVDLIKRKFENMDDLFSVVLTRLTLLDKDISERAERLTKFNDLGLRFGVTAEDKSAFSNLDFVNAVADLLAFPPELFALRVREVLLKTELIAVERELRNAAKISFL